jgi:ubiquinone/menaquinone biosynthesis C-methylase UbiE
MSEVINRWSVSAPFWEKHRDVIRQMFAPVTEALIEGGQIRSGNVVLDIATGPGEPALTLAGFVGREGKVFGIDVVPEMVAAARREADRFGIGNAQFDAAPADDLPFPNNTFDAVVSRFGVMFFPDPLNAVREVFRVLKPGRKMALAVWSFADSNPFHYAVARVLNQFADSPPSARDTFRFASLGKLKDVLEEAGAMAPSERLLHFAIEAPVPVEDFWTLRGEMSEALRGQLAGLSNDQRTEVNRLVLEALREYAADGGMRFPAEVLIVSGTKRPE